MQRIGKNNVFPKSLSAIGDENIEKSSRCIHIQGKLGMLSPAWKNNRKLRGQLLQKCKKLPP
jgi:hypothetical protein